MITIFAGLKYLQTGRRTLWEISASLLQSDRSEYQGISSEVALDKMADPRNDGINEILSANVSLSFLHSSVIDWHKVV
jgi:hypothetical protein